ncbi:S-layer homology domain-containing protein [Paenibacillus sacheonensis]|uniref:Glycoside hydrolase n=1 Tax=Paenibacillus sacheonensis TaxID=742054 RepID=A0A7X4YL31_9BACL|nr:S-layer homology domain-containing protein [Paenibacillus sacheonensis]MBM7563110.1 spore germination protein YaaH [Paenibacillus sacheonensis]NBC68323.1 glycoside hydrolase [Paenibacillus sacheonensis]
MKLTHAVRRTAAALLLSLAVGCVSSFFPYFTTRAAAAAFLPYDDIRTNYATEAIVNMTKLQLLTGTGYRRFEPDKSVTRAEFITMIERLLGIQPAASPIPAFADVQSSAWYYEWLQPAVQLQLAEGTTAALFQPNRPVTREEAAVILARALKQSSSELSSDLPEGLFEDQERIHEWAASSVYRLYQLDLMDGDDGRFLPQEQMTRQEAAVVMNRIWTHAGWSDQLHSASPENIQLGWQYGQTTSQFEQTVLQSNINTLSPHWYYLGKSAIVEDQSDLSLLGWAHSRGKRVWAMVGNHADQAATHGMLANPATRQSFVRQLADRVKKSGIDGLNIDFENMLPADRNSFTAFVSSLRQELQAIPAVLTVNVSPDLGTDWTEVFDYEAIAAHTDYVVLMGYDEHWGGDPQAGSVSSLPWLKQGIETLLLKAPADKVILALPLYTRDWTMDGKVLAASQDIDINKQNSVVLAKKLRPLWDDRLGQYTAQYADGSRNHRIWIEDGRSLSMKAAMGESYDLAGNAYWYMGGESPDIWTSLRNEARFHSYSFL